MSLTRNHPTLSANRRLFRAYFSDTKPRIIVPHDFRHTAKFPTMLGNTRSARLSMMPLIMDWSMSPTPPPCQSRKTVKILSSCGERRVLVESN
jgi:hypothetical protein